MSLSGMFSTNPLSFFLIRRNVISIILSLYGIIPFLVTSYIPTGRSGDLVLTMFFNPFIAPVFLLATSDIYSYFDIDTSHLIVMMLYVSVNILFWFSLVSVFSKFGNNWKNRIKIILSLFGLLVLEYLSLSFIFVNVSLF